jgi:uncharacterized delta-60 repeat protein
MIDQTYKTRALILTILSFALLGPINVSAAAGDVDTGFKASVGRLGGAVLSTVIQPDGKIIIAGDYENVNGLYRTGIARLNADGTTDPTFNPPEFLTQSINPVYGSINKIGLQADGKIIVGGRFSVAGQPRGLVRLNADGSLDAAFFNSAVLENVRGVGDFFIYPNGQILFTGSRFNGTSESPTFTRINADGSLDLQNGYVVFKIAVQSDGKIVAHAQGPTLIRYDADFSVDNTFQTSSLGPLNDLVIQPDGKLVLGGNFTSINGFTVNRLARINPNGTVDTSFNVGTAGANNAVNVVRIQPNGKIFIGGEFTSFNGVSVNRAALLNTDGTRDSSFNAALVAPNLFVNDIDVQSDGKVLISHGASIARLEANGSLDASFAPRVATVGIVYDTAVQPDGKILVGGWFNLANTKTTTNIARFDADGNVDNSFNPPVGLQSMIFRAIAIHPNGEILVGGTSNNVFRLSPDGSFINGFHSLSNVVYEIQVLADGKVVVAGEGGIRRFNADYTIDNTFNPPSIGPVIYKFAVQPDGKIIIVGDFNITSAGRARIARLNTDGSVDASFNPLGSANAGVWDVALQPDGKVVIAGGFTGVNFDTTKKYLARLNADGSLDTDFSPLLTAPLTAVKIQPDGKIITGGFSGSAFTLTPGKISRFNPNGTVDPTFNPSVIANDTVWHLNLQADGKILVGGEFARINQFSALGIARLLNTSAPARALFDYDGDGKADISVFRASENKWYILQSSNFALREQIFAVAGDVPVPADYDGDCKTDIAVFRPSAGAWWYLSSINNGQVNVNFGQAGDIPRPSDFDGDGKTDFVVYRPSNSVWYRLSASGQTAAPLAFGIAEDKPLVGDFDGDGKGDPAVFRPSTGHWWYASSVNGQFVAVHWGANGDHPATGDYDADGRTDFVVFRPTDGGWYILYSTGSYTIATFGTLGDRPVAADYDGDGKTDIGVFRPSTGTWYLLQTTAGFGAAQWGISSDVPTPNAFVP